jgi:hypothetical protein
MAVAWTLHSCAEFAAKYGIEVGWLGFGALVLSLVGVGWSCNRRGKYDLLWEGHGVGGFAEWDTQESGGDGARVVSGIWPMMMPQYFLQCYRALLWQQQFGCRSGARRVHSPALPHRTHSVRSLLCSGLRYSVGTPAFCDKFYRVKTGVFLLGRQTGAYHS